MKIKLFELLKNLFFVPRCIACDQRLSPISEGKREDGAEFCFCEDCLKRWNKAKGALCPVCSNLSPLCSCHPTFFKDKQPSIPSVCFYNPDSNNVQTRAILKMKRVNNTQYFEFMAKELTPSLAKVIGKMGVCSDDCVFTWIPRTNASKAESGFDQGRELAKAIAKEFNATLQPSFIRFSGKQQKKLSKKDRSKNAKESIFLIGSIPKTRFKYKSKRSRRKLFAPEKTFVIIDDVMTTGATLQTGVKLLHRAGVKNVIVACVAKTESKSSGANRREIS